MNRKRFSYFFIVVTERTRAGRTFCETELDRLFLVVLEQIRVGLKRMHTLALRFEHWYVFVRRFE